MCTKQNVHHGEWTRAFIFSCEPENMKAISSAQNLNCCVLALKQ